MSVIPYEWGRPPVKPLIPPYDLVLGSDVIYIEETYHLLIQTLELVTDSNSVVLLASKLRYEKVENFLEMIKSKFDYHDLYKNNTIHIYKITLKNTKN